MINKTFKVIGAVAFAAMTMTGAASALTSTQLIHFDELTNNSPQDEYFDPDNNFLIDAEDYKKQTGTWEDGSVNFNSGNCAPSTNGGNGNCILEMQNGQRWTLTHDGGADPTDTSPDMADYNAQYPSDEFDFLRVFFTLTGNGGSCDALAIAAGTCTNFLTIEAWDDTVSPTSLGSVTFFAGDTNATVLSYLSEYPGGASPTMVEHNQSYFADFTGISPFDVGDKKVTRITFQSGSDAQIRLDCIVVKFEGSTSQPYDPNTQCGLSDGDDGNPPLVPLPAAGWLLIGAFGGLAALRRKRKN